MRAALPETSTGLLDQPLGEAAARTADAAIRVIASQGFDKLSVRSVASELGVAPGTVQYHASSRRALLTTALIRSVQRQARRITAHQVDPTDPESLVQALAELLPTGPVQREDAAAWVAFGAAAATRPWLAGPYWQALQKFQTWVESTLTAAQRSGALAAEVAPAATARLVTALVNGLTLDLLNAPPLPTADVVAQLRRGLTLLLPRP
ncbi:TetR/AcrR family transcriptional regulator [Buchananella hordeovulneris]|uniref:TetR family transcriptional regulator n=1 Tax=Buchananella hordeovulneris TaxID=52770 RepID=A0A1Q5PU48_9ACTO|nr:TetR/AcrR family transcriptional regulator [Buchananella hordeovulneris]OKL51117.1 TetR family transcriptional regulator [Buchananella hordeovulneris]